MMKTRVLFAAIFALSLICLVITMMQFVNMGNYVDENGTSPSVVLGGELWLMIYWLKLALLGVLTLVAGIAVLARRD